MYLTSQKWFYTKQKSFYTKQEWFYTSQEWFYTSQELFYTSQELFYTALKWLYTSQELFYTALKWFYTSHEWFYTSQESFYNTTLCFLEVKVCNLFYYIWETVMLNKLSNLYQQFEFDGKSLWQVLWVIGKLEKIKIEKKCIIRNKKFYLTNLPN